jgi:hypothetical protein
VPVLPDVISPGHPGWPNGTPIPLGDIDDYKINIYRKHENNTTKTKVYVLRKTPLTGNGQIIDVDIPNGIVGFIVPRSVTLTMPKGLLLAEIEVQLPGMTNYESSLLKAGGDNYIIAEITESSNPVAEI